MQSRSRDLEEIIAHLGIKDDFCSRLNSLHQICSDIESYYHEYDYADVKCNGYRTFVMSVDLFYENLAKIARKQKSKGRKLPSIVQDYEVLSRLLCNNAEVALMIREKGSNYPFQCTDQDIAIMMRFIDIQPEVIAPIFRGIGPWNIKKGFRFQQMKIVLGLHLQFTRSFFGKAMMILSPGYRSRHQARNTLCITLDQVAEARKMDKFPICTALRVIMRAKGCTRKTIKVPRSANDWRIHLPDSKAAAVLQRKSTAIHASESGGSPKKKSVRIRGRETRPPIQCLLIKPKAGLKCNSVILHSPSGGFFMSLADVTVRLMAKVARTLGVTVVLIKYATAPESPYPAALQDVLDTYMFLSSGSSEVSSLLGFIPEDIMLSGDSAGGNFSMATMIALNEIRRQNGAVRMPKAVSMQYPAMTIGFVTSPSMCMNGLDIFTTIGVLKLAIVAYTQTDPPIDLAYSLTKYNDVDVWSSISTRFNDRLRDPLHNPLVYDHFDDLKDIPINIMACEVDCLVDHSIVIAKKWQGPVTLDVARGLPHAFLLSDRHVSAMADELKLLIRRYAECLDLHIPLKGN